MRKIIYSTVAAAAVAAGSLALALPASATTTAPAFKVITVDPYHSDTTSVTGSATQQDPSRGPVWGYDHLKETITANPVKGQPGNWNVTISFTGSTFTGFADPRTDSADPGGPLGSKGTLNGNEKFFAVPSSSQPDPGNVPATEPASTSISTVLSQLFDGGNGPAASSSYSLHYTEGPQGSVDVTGSGNSWPAGTVVSQSG